LRPQAIHQIHEGCAYGDGVTNGMFFIQRMLQDSGFASEIYCQNIPERLTPKVRPLSTFKDDPTNLTLFHYSLGTPHDHWVTELGSPKILVYHNITPHAFFPRTSELYRLCRMGREQLKWWAASKSFVGAIADSQFNADELIELGFSSAAPIGLLVDLDAIYAKRRESRSFPLTSKDRKTLLFVGNFIEHKGQLELVRAFAELRQISDTPTRLVLAGGTTSANYRKLVEDEIVNLNLANEITLAGKCTRDQLYFLYREADLYVSLSAHEGFGMPLVEAMAFGVPVLAYSAGSVSATLNGGGHVLMARDPRSVAAGAKYLLEDPHMRSGVLRAQRRALDRYQSPILARSLQDYLRARGFEVDLRSDLLDPTFSPTSRSISRTWRIEGPIDSSYSLAIVNRQLALALSATDEFVSITSRDGPGPFKPNVEFLARNPPLMDLWRASQTTSVPDVVLRNQYPPDVLDMRGDLRGLANYAWEESGFPLRHVKDFNTSLNLITVTSRFVAKTLRDNGVHTPMFVVGNGVDHIARPTAEEAPPRLRGPFRFLHLSSGFPRKGFDILLRAWIEAFAKDQDVELVVKTFDNPHNEIPEALRQFRIAHPVHAPITLIQDDMDAEELRRLYLSIDALVAPSRGEGFGLPLAEALWLGRSVVTVAYGGQTDFCTSETAWLCDYSFAGSKSHLSVPDSVWIEPSFKSLAQTLDACRQASEEERQRRIDAGQILLSREFVWRQVAERTRQAVKNLAELDPGVLSSRKMGWISTWNSRCGIAAYARSLSCAIDPDRLTVFANRGVELLQEDDSFVRRCWTQGWDDSLEELTDAVISSGVEIAVIQFNFGFFRLDLFARFLKRLRVEGILTLVFLHATADVVKPGVEIRLADAREALSNCTRLLVHSVHDLNRLKAIGLIRNVTLFPQGIASFDGNRAVLRSAAGRPRGRPLIASFGFLLPHKGLRQLLEAFAILRRTFPQAHLLMLNALYPAAESDAEHQALRAYIAAEGLGENVSLETEYLQETEIIARLSPANVVVFPYQQTQESGSAAIKLGLASLSPVACTPLPIFDDGADVIHRLPGISPAAIAEGLKQLLSETSHSGERLARQTAWVDAHAWPLLSRRLDNLAKGLVFDAEVYPGRSSEETVFR
jgi:glycosyltransferase involved in cell wall biosynthesis